MFAPTGEDVWRRTVRNFFTGFSANVTRIWPRPFNLRQPAHRSGAGSFEGTGKSLLAWQQTKGQALIDDDSARKIVLLPDRAWLSERIARRFALMWDNGAIDEVKALLTLDLDPALPSMKAIGVREITAFLQGSMSREEAIERSVIATRQYAKRQSTWFRNQLDDRWCVNANSDDAFARLTTTK